MANLIGHECAVLGAHQAHINFAIRESQNLSQVSAANLTASSDAEFVDFLEEAKKAESKKLSARERMALKFPEDSFWK